MQLAALERDANLEVGGQPAEMAGQAIRHQHRLLIVFSPVDRAEDASRQAGQSARHEQHRGDDHQAHQQLPVLGPVREHLLQADEGEAPATAPARLPRPPRMTISRTLPD